MSLINLAFSGSDKLTIWAASDPHPVLEDASFAFNSLQLPLSQIDGEDWEFGMILGDYWNNGVETAAGGVEIVSQFNAGLSIHNRSQSSSKWIME